MSFDTLAVRRQGAVLFAEIAAPPMNLLGPELVRDVVSLIQQAEADPAVKVLVFKSADRDYFISHVDVTRISEYRQEAAKLTGEASLALLFRHLSASRLVTIAQIEGRARGAGSEFALACDMRFARPRVGNLWSVRASLRSGPGRRCSSTPHPAHGTGQGPRDHVRRRQGSSERHCARADRGLPPRLGPLRCGSTRAAAQARIQAAMERGFQKRETEMALGRQLGEWNR